MFESGHNDALRSEILQALQRLEETRARHEQQLSEELQRGGGLPEELRHTLSLLAEESRRLRSLVAG
jgi:hypothetical protein